MDLASHRFGPEFLVVLSPCANRVRCDSRLIVSFVNSDNHVGGDYFPRLKAFRQPLTIFKSSAIFSDQVSDRSDIYTSGIL